ncbi:MAG: type VI secretion system tip protein VgrG [Planctomycetes bacterium]|nr:type VI secretion system tip protein VgrG [Planctomycetota bacterium]
MALSQSQRFCSFDSPLGPDALLLRRMTAEEGVSQLFVAELQVESESQDHDAHDVVGKPGLVKLVTADGGTRLLHGIVTRFDQGGRDSRVAYYRVELRPWLWLLTRRADCRIFQGKSVPDIVAEVFQEANCADFELQLQGSYPPRDFCVQYRETDFAFVSRLLEEEGIFYYFRHEQNRHVLVLTDTAADQPDCPGQVEVDYHSAEGGQHARDTIDALEREQELHPGKCSLKDFNFEDPGNPLSVSAPTADSIGGNQNLEVYDYSAGDYGNSGEGNRLVRLRIQAEEAASVRVTGRSNCRAFTGGHRFTLQKHFRGALNGRQYMLTSVRHQLVQPSALHGGEPGEENAYRNEFACVPADAPFRPRCATPRPAVRGPQTAIVVGPPGEEIHVDKYGRIKVQFHWDRLGKKDDASSCWIRVSRSWASKQWGQVAHPRIGDEVIVEFLEGDPDRPIVTGCVYNAQTMPPYDLPANKTQAGVKSRSSPNGAPANFNEIRFEDKKGSEQLHIQAEKNKTVLVKNDRSEQVGHDETIAIGHDRTETVGNDETLTVEKNRTRTVGENETITVGKNRSLTVGEAQEETIGKSQTATVGENETISVGKNRSLTVGENSSETVGKNRTQDVGEKLTVTVGKDAALTIGGEQSVKVRKAASLSAKEVQVMADDALSLVAGTASITLKKDGTVIIKGKKITVQGSGDVVIKGSKIAQN